MRRCKILLLPTQSFGSLYHDCTQWGDISWLVVHKVSICKIIWVSTNVGWVSDSFILAGFGIHNKITKGFGFGSHFLILKKNSYIKSRYQYFEKQLNYFHNVGFCKFENNWSSFGCSHQLVIIYFFK